MFFCKRLPGRVNHQGFHLRWLVGGFQPTPLKNDGVKVSWDDEILDWMEKS